MVTVAGTTTCSASVVLTLNVSSMLRSPLRFRVRRMLWPSFTMSAGAERNSRFSNGAVPSLMVVLLARSVLYSPQPLLGSTTTLALTSPSRPMVCERSNSALRVMYPPFVSVLLKYVLPICTCSSLSFTRYTRSVHPLRVFSPPTLLTFHVIVAFPPGTSFAVLMVTSLVARSGLDSRCTV